MYTVKRINLIVCLNKIMIIFLDWSIAKLGKALVFDTKMQRFESFYSNTENKVKKNKKY